MTVCNGTEIVSLYGSKGVVIMTKYDAMDVYRNDIRSALIECTEDAMRSHGKTVYSIYCWEHDGVQVLEDVSGGSMFLSNDGEDQALFFITLVDVGIGFDPVEEIRYRDGREEDEGGFIDENDAIDMLMAEIDWDEQMDEIEESFFYEKGGC